MEVNRPEITAERLREILEYNPKTGIFTWLTSTRRRSLGKVAGCQDSYGYVVIRINRSNHKAHRLAWLYLHGEWPEGQIDHINGVKSDNRIANLRCVTPLENSHNLFSAPRHSKTGLLGVSSKRGKWRAQIRVDGGKVHIGTFETPEEAHAAYLEAKRIHHPTSQRWKL